MRPKHTLARKTAVVVLPITEMRYFTLDDYFVAGSGTLVVRVADTGDETSNRLLLIHALVEHMLAEAKGVTPDEIDRFDFEWEKHRMSDEGCPNEPGDDASAPYRDAHSVAIGIERILLGHMGIPWADHEARLADCEKEWEACKRRT